jgi:hypothetical protein
MFLMGNPQTVDFPLPRLITVGFIEGLGYMKQVFGDYELSWK